MRDVTVKQRGRKNASMYDILVNWGRGKIIVREQNIEYFIYLIHVRSGFPPISRLSLSSSARVAHSASDATATDLSTDFPAAGSRHMACADLLVGANIFRSADKMHPAMPWSGAR